MKFTLALIASVAASAVAYMPPADQQNGAYKVTFDQGGNAITERHEAASVPVSGVRARTPRKSPAVSKRAQFPLETDQDCTGNDIDAGDYANVQNCMDIFLTQQSGEHGYGIYYCRSGDALLAVCNYGNTLYGGPDEIDQFNGQCDFACGDYRSCWLSIRPWAKSYWRTSWGETICGNLNAAPTEIN